MDTIVWSWIWLLIKVLLFLVSLRIFVWLIFWILWRVWLISIAVEGIGLLSVDVIRIVTKDFELELKDVHLQFRLFYSTVKLFRISIYQLQLQWTTSSSAGHRAVTRSRKIGIKRRIMYRLLRWLSKLFEMYIYKIDIAHQDLSPGTGEVGYLDLLQCSKGVNILMEPLPSKLISVELKFSNVFLHSLIYINDDAPALMDSNMFSIIEGSLNLKCNIFLSLSSDRIIDSVQLIVSSVESQLHGSKALRYLKQRLRTDAASTNNTKAQLSLHNLPQKIEVLVCDVNVKYKTDSSSKLLQFTFKRLSLDVELIGNEKFIISLTGGWFNLKSLNNDFIQLKQINAGVKYLSDYVEVSLSLISLKGTFNEYEICYWLSHFKKHFNESSNQMISANSPFTSFASLLALAYNLPVAMVTKLEVSDWIMDFDVDNSTLCPTKGSLCQLVLVDGALKVGLTHNKQINVSCQLTDGYVHLPGIDHTSKSNNSSILPSSSVHIWGRVCSIGSLTLCVTSSLIPINEQLPNKVIIGEQAISPLIIEGRGYSIIYEWCQPTFRTFSLLFKHLIDRYGNLTGSSQKSSAIPELVNRLSLVIEGVNGFVYENDPLLLMLVRVDSCCIQFDEINSFSFKLYNLAADEMYFSHYLNQFECVPVANLPSGGLLDVNVVHFQYFRNEIHCSIDKMVINWNTHCHCTLNKLVQLLMTQFKSLKKEDESNIQSQNEMKLLGITLQKFLKSLPVTLIFELEDCTVNLNLNSAKVSLHSKTSHCSLLNDKNTIDSHVMLIQFDGHNILTITDLLITLLYGEPILGRNQFPQLQLKNNAVLSLFASQVEVSFPYQYKFYSSYSTLTSVRKFIQQYHRSATATTSSVNVPPDILLEVDELIFSLEDDWLEIKLGANYEVMKDEYIQKLQRLETLNERLRTIKGDQGVLSQLSAKQELSVYESLDKTNAKVYCQRIKEMYSSEPLKTQLLTVCLSQTQLALISDPTILGYENVLKHLKEIDTVSDIPNEYGFSTIWGCYIYLTSEHLEVQIKDYQWKLLEGEILGVSGRLVFAEQEAKERECYTVTIPVGEPWEMGVVTRKLPPLKYYHDINITADNLAVSWGPNLDPSFAQINYCFNFITNPSLDPSPPLPWWDKLRLLLHGEAKLNTPQLSINILPNNDPYNSSEYMELRLLDADAHLVDNVSLSVNCGVQSYVHTASRYDECQLLVIPSVTLKFGFNFQCLNDLPHHHHYVVRCCHDKLPVLSEGRQLYDSYSMFRSLSVILSLSLKVHNVENAQSEILLYASTIKWLQSSLEIIRSHVSRPIKKGLVHKNVRPKRQRFTRLIKYIDIDVQFPEVILCYWSSVRKQDGIECSIKDITFKLTYTLNLIPFDDGLTRRPRADWSMSACEGCVNGIKGYTCIKQLDKSPMIENDPYVISNPYSDDEGKDTLQKYLLLELDKISYIWQNMNEDETSQEFTHQLKLFKTKIVWNDSSRSVIYKIIDTYQLHKRLKQDLSTEALQSILTKYNDALHDSKVSTEPVTEPATVATGTKKPRHLRRHSSGCTMLDQLLGDICNTLVTSEEQREKSDPKLKGILAANTDDVQKYNWLIELDNTQVALKGVEKNGYIICSSYIAQVFGRDHEPQLREGDLVSKSSWVAKVQDLQYFCSDETSDNFVPWLPVSVIQPPALQVLPCENDEESFTAVLLRQLGPDLAHPIGVQETMTSRPPGEAVGGLVNGVTSVGLITEDAYGNVVQMTTLPNSVMLQRIASRCHCQMFYISFGGQVDSSTNITSSTHETVKSSNEAIDTFTFRYPSAEICTTSKQYSLILDILNKLLLYKEPRKKEATEQHARMKFMLQLATISDIRKPVLAKQTKIRQILNKLKSLENDLYFDQKSGTDSSLHARDNLVNELIQAKENLSQASLELRAMIRAFKEKRLSIASNNISPEPVRRIEVWLDDAQWNLMQEDGQLQISDIKITNFSYNRVTYNDDSGEHRLELGSFRAKNCVPNTPALYQEVLSPFDPAARRLRVDKNVSLRIFCRDQAPVAGISVTEHLEINVVPLSVRLTEKFYQTLQEFFLPKAEMESKETLDQDHSHVFGGLQPTIHSDTIDGNTFSSRSRQPNVVHSPPDSPPPTTKDVHRKSKRSSAASTVDEIETMKERASNIKTFIYVKIPQLTLCITYKGESISVKEMNNQLVTVPTVEYHNLNMSWRSLLLEIKKDYKNAIIAQTIRSAIGMKESEERAGLSSPKLGRSEFLMGKVIKETKENKGKTRKLFGKREQDLVEEENDQ